MQVRLEIPTLQLQLRWILLRGIKQSLKNINRLLFQISKNPGIYGHFNDCTEEVLKGPKDHNSDTDEEVQRNAGSEI